MSLRNPSPFLCWAAFATTLAAQTAGAPQGTPPHLLAPLDPMREALSTGATVSQIFLEYLKPNATPEFPGIESWVKGAGATLAALEKDNPSDAWRALDPEQLITRNPAWWQAFFEISPGDPGLALLHGGTLLTAGDAQRAMIVLRLALNHKDLDAGSAKVIISVMQHAGAYMEPSHSLVRQGVELHDKGDYLGAIARHDAALKVWPRNGWALYEKGFSILLNEVKNKGLKGGGHPPLVQSLYARCREVDPFQWNAWQGKTQELPGLVEMQALAKPLWEKCQGDLNYQLTEEELEELARALQLAKVDDLALVARQILIHHRGRYVPEDHPFITKSLRRLVSGDRTEATLAKLSGPSFKAVRIYGALDEGENKKEK
jgi:tetratricopeptide (TPR) repeat protein